MQYEGDHRANGVCVKVFSEANDKLEQFVSVDDASDFGLLFSLLQIDKEYLHEIAKHSRDADLSRHRITSPPPNVTGHYSRASNCYYLSRLISDLKKFSSANSSQMAVLSKSYSSISRLISPRGERSVLDESPQTS